jgi:hypothetical protein
VLLISCQSKQERLEEEFLKNAPQLIYITNRAFYNYLYENSKNNNEFLDYLYSYGLNNKLDNSDKIKYYKSYFDSIHNTSPCFKTLHLWTIELKEKLYFDDEYDSLNWKNFESFELSENLAFEKGYASKLQNDLKEYIKIARNITKNTVDFGVDWEDVDYCNVNFNNLPAGICLLRLKQIAFEICKVESELFYYVILNSVNKQEHEIYFENRFYNNFPIQSIIEINNYQYNSDDTIKANISLFHYSKKLQKIYVNDKPIFVKDGIGKVTFRVDSIQNQQGDTITKSIKVAIPILLPYGDTVLTYEKEYKIIK